MIWQWEDNRQHEPKKDLSATFDQQFNHFLKFYIIDVTCINMYIYIISATPVLM